MLAAAGLLLGGAGLSLARPESSFPSRVACSMSSNGKRVRKPEPYLAGKGTPFQPGDEQATYTQAQLIRMDNRFRARLLRAFKRGEENRESAAQAYIIPSKSLVELLAFPPHL